MSSYCTHTYIEDIPTAHHYLITSPGCQLKQSWVNTAVYSACVLRALLICMLNGIFQNTWMRVSNKLSAKGWEVLGYCPKWREGKKKLVHASNRVSVQQRPSTTLTTMIFMCKNSVLQHVENLGIPITTMYEEEKGGNLYKCLVRVCTVFVNNNAWFRPL